MSAGADLGAGVDDLPVEVEDFLLSLRVERGRSANTLKAYANDLRAYVTWLDGRGLTIGEVDEVVITDYVNALKGGDRAPSTVKRALVSVRGLHRFLAEETEGVRDPTLEVEVPRSPKGLPKALSEDEVGRLLASIAGTDPIARRDRAILEVLYGTGVRIGELSGMSLSDLDLDAVGGPVEPLGGPEERVGEAVRDHHVIRDTEDEHAYLPYANVVWRPSPGRASSSA